MSWSYTSTRIGWAPRFSEALNLYRVHSQKVPAQVKQLLRRLHDIEEDVKHHAEVRLDELDVLEIGSGQMSKYLRYFAIRNNAVGIDLDVVSDELSIPALVKTLRTNGPVRTGKTVARKTLGLDAKFANEFCRQLGVAHLPLPRVLQMNAEEMTFDGATFDFVFSCSTFEHLSDPRKVIDEVNRVLRPGGVAYIILHLYTSDSGCHDPRISAGRREDLPYWSHLRPQHIGKVRSNAYLNKLRLADWRDLFCSLPNVWLRTIEDDLPDLRSELARLRRAGELRDYPEEELLTREVVAVWKRPG
jgi:SAM-dependent methyltransferase